MSISAPESSLAIIQTEVQSSKEPEQIVRDIQEKLCKGNFTPSNFIESFECQNEKQKWYPIMDMLKYGYLTESELRNWVEQGCDALARKLYQSATKQYADDLFHPEYLAWGLSRGLFSWNERRLIRFDHGDDRGFYRGKEYVIKYLPKDLIDSIVKKLCNPISWEQDIERIKSNMKQISAKVDDCCDEHCCC